MLRTANRVARPDQFPQAPRCTFCDCPIQAARRAFFTIRRQREWTICAVLEYSLGAEPYVALHGGEA